MASHYTVYSQAAVSGNVIDNAGNAVPFASVILLQVLDSTVVAFSITDAQGKYSLTHKSGNYWLQIRCMGYEFQQHSILISESELLNFDIILTESVASIGEVTVTARDPGIRIRGDTIRYHPELFTDGSERVLGDVLNKLPGIEVDDRGKVTAHGKQVETILLNGQDFFSGNTRMATENLSADIAETIDILNNYSEFSLLRGFQTSERTVINIGVNKKRLGKISGNIDAGGGYDKKISAKGNIMQINPKYMTTLLSSVNNTGDEVFSIEDYILLQGGVSALMDNNHGQSTVRLSDAEQRMLVRQNNTFEMLNGLSAINMAFQPKPVLNINSHFLFNGNREKLEDMIIQRYEFPDNQRFETSQQLNSNRNNWLCNGFLKINYQKSEKFSMAYKGSISNINLKQNSNSVNSINSSPINVFDIRNAQTFNTKHDFLMMKTVFGRHLLTTGISLSYSSKPSNYDLRTDFLLLPVPLISQNDWYHGRQNIETEQLNAGANISFFYRLNQTFHIRTSLNFDVESQKFNSAISQRINDTYYLLDADSLKNKFSFNIRNHNVYLGIAKTLGFFRFNLGTSAHIYSFVNAHINNVSENRQFSLNPSSELSLHFKPNKNVLSLSFSRSIQPYPANAFISGIVFDSDRSFSRHSEVDLLCVAAYNANLSYRLISLFSGTTFFIISGYQIFTSTNTNNIFQTGLLTESRPILSSPSSNFFSKLQLSQRLGRLPLTTTFSGGFGRNEFVNWLANTDNKYRLNRLTGKIQLSSNFRKTFDFELRTEYEYATFGMKNTQLVQRYAGKIKSNFNKRLFAETELEYAMNNGNNFNRTFFYLNPCLRYTLNTSLEFSIVGANILNLKRQDWVSSTFNGIYLTERYYRQIPGNIMLKANYRF